MKNFFSEPFLKFDPISVADTIYLLSLLFSPANVYKKIKIVRKTTAMKQRVTFRYRISKLCLGHEKCFRVSNSLKKFCSSRSPKDD